MEAILAVARAQIASQLESYYQGGLQKCISDASGCLKEAYVIKAQLEMQVYNNKSTYLNNAFDKIDFSEIKNASDFKETVNKMVAYARWQGAKDMVYDDYVNRKLNTSMEGLMKKSYQVIESINKITTGHNPTYHVAFAVGRGNQRKIYEGDIPINMILDAARLEPVWRNSSIDTSLKLRLAANVDTKKQWAKLSTVTELTGDTLDEYKTIMSAISDITYQNKKGETRRVTNEGNKFEIYRKYLIMKQTNKDKNLLQQITQEVMSNTKSFAVGEDFEYTTTANNWLLSPSINLQDLNDNQEITRYESLKSFMGSNPSLASLSTLISTLQNICSTLGTDIQAIQGKAQSILNSKIQDDGSLTSMLEKEVKERLQQELGQMFKI